MSRDPKACATENKRAPQIVLNGQVEPRPADLQTALIDKNAKKSVRRLGMQQGCGDLKLDTKIFVEVNIRARILFYYIFMIWTFVACIEISVHHKVQCLLCLIFGLLIWTVAWEVHPSWPVAMMRPIKKGVISSLV